MRKKRGKRTTRNPRREFLEEDINLCDGYAIFFPYIFTSIFVVVEEKKMSKQLEVMA